MDPASCIVAYDAKNRTVFYCPSNGDFKSRAALIVERAAKYSKPAKGYPVAKTKVDAVLASLRESGIEVQDERESTRKTPHSLTKPELVARRDLIALFTKADYIRGQLRLAIEENQMSPGDSVRVAKFVDRAMRAIETLHNFAGDFDDAYLVSQPHSTERRVFAPHKGGTK